MYSEFPLLLDDEFEGLPDLRPISDSDDSENNDPNSGSDSYSYWEIPNKYRKYDPDGAPVCHSEGESIKSHRRVILDSIDLSERLKVD